MQHFVALVVLVHKVVVQGVVMLMLLVIVVVLVLGGHVVASCSVVERIRVRVIFISGCHKSWITAG